MKKVMIIEDDEAISDILSIILTNEGYLVVSGKGNELMMTTSGLSLPDLFLIDRNLPGIDGIAICRTLKSDPATQHIPVVMISANHSFIKPAAAAGADACIPKPFSRQELLETVGQFCGTPTD